ncbi:RDD family protein [Adhaeribacter radiodurans]|uniref:RDD family protein n=1 Tax=Adhaeribacter radiodurans TaxID=2745197 RepID=A0A7L7LAX2_9BACT|nr:RDD family protein [Adhaeribacter radiodurans]QMU29887.1 RDD family protein [Adhaeribacter radiodurans]
MEPITLSYPSLRRRLLSYSVDLFFIILVFMLTGVLIDYAGEAPNWLRGFVLLFMLFIYEPLFVSIFGGTLGHQLFRMRVVDEKTYENLSFLPAIGRFLVKTFLGWLSFLTTTFNPRRRAIHDLAAGSLMVQVG